MFFLAGHETTASVLTWVFYILSQQPGVLRRIREEVEQVTGGGDVLRAQLLKSNLGAGCTCGH